MSVEDAAKRIGVIPRTLRFWEAGAFNMARPNLEQMRKAANAYKIPLSALYFDKPPDEAAPELPDLRQFRQGESREWSLAMHGTFRRVQMQREVAIDIAEAADETPELINLIISTSDSPETTAVRIRTWLGVSLHEQTSWKSEYQALAGWTRSVERKGILVAQSRGVQLDEMRGFAIGEQPFPVIVLNGYDKSRAKIFTLLHELVHVLLHSSSLCDLADNRRLRSPKIDVETFCNQLAGAVLLPYSAMAEELADQGVREPILWPDATLAQMARRYNVSREVVLRRMVSLDRATLDYYFQKLHQYKQQYEEQDRKERDAKDGGPDSSVLKLRDLGRRYTTDVLRAYGRRDIDAAELATYLDARLDQIPRISALLEREP